MGFPCYEKQCSVIFQIVPLSPPYSQKKGVFSGVYCVNLVYLLEVNLTKLWEFSTTGSPYQFLTNRVVHTESPGSHQLQYWVSYPGAGSSGGFSLLGSAKVSCYILLGSAWVSCNILYLPVGLSHLGRSSLLGILTHPLDPRRVVDFPSVQHFPCYQDGVGVSELLTYRTGNQKFPLY